MKLPFSYKHPGSSFNALLLISFVGHLAVFGGGSLFTNFTPRFAVQKAPSSMEVVILKEKPRKEEKVPELRLLSVKKPLPESPAVRQKLEEKPRERKIEKSWVSPEERGALKEKELSYFKNPPPVYPAHAREESWEGVVVLKALVGSDGRPRQLEVYQSSGYKILDEAAFKAVKGWRFLPARAGRFSFSSWIKIPIRFRLVEE